MVREEPAVYGTPAAARGVAYFDASALVKRYVATEAGAAAVAAEWQIRERHASANVSVEIRGALARLRREGRLSATEETSLAATARADEPEMELIPSAPPVLEEAIRLVAVHPLRTIDALHLASALLLARRGPKDLVVVTADQRLATAARAEGLRVLVPA